MVVTQGVSRTAVVWMFRILLLLLLLLLLLIVVEEFTDHINLQVFIYGRPLSFTLSLRSHDCTKAVPKVMSNNFL